MSFRWRLIIVITLFVSLAVVAIGTILTRRASDILMEQTSENIALQTDILRTRVQSLLDDTARALKEYSESQSVLALIQDVKSQGIDAVLASRGREALVPAYEQLFNSPLISGGMVETMALYAPNTDEPYLTVPEGPEPETGAAKGICSGPGTQFVAIRRFGDTIVQCHTVQYPLSQQVIGYLGVKYNADYLNKLLKDYRPNSNTTVFIFTPMARPPKDRGFFIRAGLEPDDSFDGLAQNLLHPPGGAPQQKNQTLAVEYKDLMGSFLPLFGDQLYVGTIQPVSSVLARIREFRRWTWSLLVIANIIAIVLAMILSDRLSGPVRGLIKDLNRVGAGELDHKVKPAGGGREIKALAETVNDMTDNLRRTQQELLQAEKLSAIGTLAAGIAHEIKNPLSSIQFTLELLREQAQFKDESEATFRKVMAEIERLDEVVRKFLAYARPQSLTPESTNLADFLEETTVFMLAEAQSRENIRIVKNYEPVAKVSIDRNAMALVIQNLAANALESMPDGGTLTMGVYNVQYGGRNRVLIRIEDTGCGMDREEMARVFEPFWSGKKGGTGLGLSIAQHLVKLHGGNLVLESQKLVGTRAFVYLPFSYSAQ